MRRPLAAALLLVWPLLSCGWLWTLTDSGAAAIAQLTGSVSQCVTSVGIGAAIALACLGAGAGWRLAHPAPPRGPLLYSEAPRRGLPEPYPIIEGEYDVRA